jgi:hypothetical protein
LKVLVLIILLLLVVNDLFGQKDFYPGYIVTNSGDTIYGMVKDRKSSRLKIYSKIHLKNSKGKKRKYGPGEILAYESGGNTYHSVWYRERQFLKVIEKGYVTYYYDESVDEDGYLFETKLLKRENEQRFTTIIGIGFRKKTMNYFADCPELVRKLDARQYRFNSLGEAVRFYNRECGM